MLIVDLSWVFPTLLSLHLVHGDVYYHECSGDRRCDETCEYSSWVSHANCRNRDLTDIPMECCGVETLDVGHNAITVLRKRALHTFKDLKHLFFEKNRLSGIERGVFVESPKLEYLSMGENNIRVLSGQALEGTWRLKHLMMTHGQLVDVEAGAFSQSPKLKTFDLGDNQLTTPLCNVFSSGNILEDLSLTDNRVSHLPSRCFRNLTSLKNLRLDSNPIGIISELDTFEGLSSLKLLDLGNTSLSHISIPVFRHVQNIDTLILSNNDFTVLEERNFIGLPMLLNLNLEHNLITVVNERAFDGLNFLEILVLSNNRIHSMGNGVLVPMQHTLRELHLHGNRLADIQNISAGVSSLSLLFLARNPLNCSCHLAPLVLWSASHQAAANTSEGAATCLPDVNLSPIEGPHHPVSVLHPNVTRSCHSEIDVVSQQTSSLTETKYTSVATTLAAIRPGHNESFTRLTGPAFLALYTAILTIIIIISILGCVMCHFKRRPKAQMNLADPDTPYFTIEDKPPGKGLYSTRIRMRSDQADCGDPDTGMSACISCRDSEIADERSSLHPSYRDNSRPCKPRHVIDDGLFDDVDHPVMIRMHSVNLNCRSCVDVGARFGRDGDHQHTTIADITMEPSPACVVTDMARLNSGSGDGQTSFPTATILDHHVHETANSQKQGTLPYKRDSLDINNNNNHREDDCEKTSYPRSTAATTSHSKDIIITSTGKSGSETDHDEGDTSYGVGTATQQHDIDSEPEVKTDAAVRGGNIPASSQRAIPRREGTGNSPSWPRPRPASLQERGRRRDRYGAPIVRVPEDALTGRGGSLQKQRDSVTRRMLAREEHGRCQSTMLPAQRQLVTTV